MPQRLCKSAFSQMLQDWELRLGISFTGHQIYPVITSVCSVVRFVNPKLGSKNMVTLQSEANER